MCEEWPGFTAFGEEMCVAGFKTLLGTDDKENIHVLLICPSGQKSVANLNLKRGNCDLDQLLRLQASITISVSEKKKKKKFQVRLGLNQRLRRV